MKLERASAIGAWFGFGLGPSSLHPSEVEDSVWRGSYESCGVTVAASGWRRSQHGGDGYRDLAGASRRAFGGNRVASSGGPGAAGPERRGRPATARRYSADDPA